MVKTNCIGIVALTFIVAILGISVIACGGGGSEVEDKQASNTNAAPAALSPQEKAALESKLRKELESQLRAELEPKIRADIEIQVRSEMQARQKAEAEAKRRLDAEAAKREAERQKAIQQAKKQADEDAKYKTLGVTFVSISGDRSIKTLKFRITNNTNKVINSFKAGISFYDQYGDDMDRYTSLGITRDEPLKPGESFITEGQWLGINSRVYDMLAKSPEKVTLKIRVSKMIHDGKVVDFSR